MSHETVIQLDVRPVLAGGEEPFQLIMETADRVPPAGAIDLTAPFEPIPLYQVMSERGFGHLTSCLDGGDYLVRFVRLDITAESTVGEVHERYSATAPVFAEYGLDLCCGGAMSLTAAAEAHGVELASLLGALQQAAMP